MTVTAYRYPLDPTGNNPDNLIVNEVHDIGIKAVRAVAPTYGAYYTDTITIVDDVTEKPLVKNVDFSCVELLQDASLRYGKEICVMVLILNKTVGSKVRLTYQTVGGQFQYDGSSIVNLYEAAIKDARPVKWEDVLNTPLEYPPSFHKHMLEDVQGFEPVVAAIERVRNAIVLSDVPAFDALINWMQTKFGDLNVNVLESISDLDIHLKDLDNPHKVTKAQVSLGSVANYAPVSAEEVSVDVAVKKYVTYDMLLEFLARRSGNVANYSPVSEAETDADTPVIKYVTYDMLLRFFDRKVGNIENLDVVSQQEADAGTPIREYVTYDILLDVLEKRLSGLTPNPDPPTFYWTVEPAQSTFTEGDSVVFSINSFPTAVVTTPTVTSVVNGTVVYLTGSSFSISGNSDTHISSDWQVSVSDSFSVVFAETTNSLSDKTSWSASGLGSDTTYYARVRYKSSGGVLSDWSNPHSFTTAPATGQLSVIAKPAVVYPATTTDLESTVVFRTSDFGTTSGTGTHSGSDWQLSVSGTFTTINKEATASTVNKTVWTVSDLLPNTSYYVRVRHNSNDGAVSEWSTPFAFRTATGAVDYTDYSNKIVSPSASEGFAVTPWGGGVCISLSADGSTACVGDYVNTKVFVYKKSGSNWSLTQTLNPGVGKGFGHNLTTTPDGSVMAVCASLYEVVNSQVVYSPGKVLVYTKQAGLYVLKQTLQASDKYTEDMFGRSVSISDDGNKLLVGGPGSEAMYLFSRSSGVWTEQLKLSSPSDKTYQKFGSTVCISGDGATLAGNSPGWGQAPGAENGAVFVFAYTGTSWGTGQTLINSDNSPGQKFGHCLSLSYNGDVLAAGTQSTSYSTPTKPGKVYVFSRKSGVWSEDAIFVADNSQAGDEFGATVAVSADGALCMVGSTNDKSVYGTRTGSAYLFKLENKVWSKKEKVVSQDAKPEDKFGSSVAISKNNAFFAVGSGDGGVGAVYIYAIKSLSVISKPSVVSPINNSTDRAGAISITSSAFAVASGADTHLSSDWELSTSNTFSSVINSLLASTVNKTTWSVSGLTENTTYYVRVRYTAASGTVSPWSNVSSFSTAVSFNSMKYLNMLTASDAVASANPGEITSYFGYSVALSGNGKVCVVGDYIKNTENGKVYIYEKQTDGSWQQKQMLEPTLQFSTGDTRAQFGASVAISFDGSVVAVGSPRESTGTVNSYTGAVYVFRRVTAAWQLIVKRSGASPYQYGLPLSLSNDGTVLAVCAYWVPSGSGALGVTVFKIQGSSLDQIYGVTGGSRLAGLSGDGKVLVTYVSGQAPVAVSVHRLEPGVFSNNVITTFQQAITSCSLSYDGSVIAIGNTSANSSSGEVYIYGFIKSNIAFIQTLRPSTIRPNSYFGVSVALTADGKTCLAGEPASGCRAYLFKNEDGGWVEKQILRGLTTVDGDGFGQAVSVSSGGNVMAVGAYLDDVTYTNQGSVYIFEKYSVQPFGYAQVLTTTTSVVNGAQLPFEVVVLVEPAITELYWGVRHIDTTDANFVSVSGTVAVGNFDMVFLSLETRKFTEFSIDRSFQIVIYADIAHTVELGRSAVLTVQGGLMQALIDGVDVFDPDTPLNAYTFFLADMCDCND